MIYNEIWTLIMKTWNNTFLLPPPPLQPKETARGALMVPGMTAKIVNNIAKRSNCFTITPSGDKAEEFLLQVGYSHLAPLLSLLHSFVNTEYGMTEAFFCLSIYWLYVICLTIWNIPHHQAESEESRDEWLRALRIAKGLSFADTI